MNYCDNKNLKEDMESLNDRLYEVWREVKRMEQTYRWNSDNLADRLAGKISVIFRKILPISLKTLTKLPTFLLSD